VASFERNARTLHPWLDKRFTDLLREHNVALALTHLSNMPRPWEVKDGLDLVTADFVYAPSGE